MLDDDDAVQPGRIQKCHPAWRFFFMDVLPCV
jgi:hypothetical protein